MNILFRKLFNKKEVIKPVIRKINFDDKKEYMVLAKRRTVDFVERENYYRNLFLKSYQL